MDDLISFEDLIVQPYNSYFNLEKELYEVKSKLSLMEQRLKYLENRLDCLEEDKLKKMEDDKQIITIADNHQFLDTNCSDINFVYHSPSDTCMMFDEVKIIHFAKTFDKIINKLKNIKNIVINFRFPVDGHSPSFKPYLDHIKKIIEINNEIKIIITLHSHLDIHTFKYIFKDLQIYKISSLNISFPGRNNIENSTELYDYLKDFIKDFDDFNYKKFTINPPPPNFKDPCDIGY